ncbi:MAG: thioredoxin domain-containing protein [Spirochaetaceae bacterium]|nr:MAG: thioredoxin domain-containing protein [Spirochaetaceae bacterium]
MSQKKQTNLQFDRNNLDRAVSPYLRSHAENPVHWQEWSQTALQHARRHDLILLVSVGYSTCHWCHVMAADSFSDSESAAYLNRYFMPIKVDREERPDIDQYMMSFLVETTGAGGWPLNVFLSPDLRPFFAMTYAAPQPRFGRPGFLDILQRVKAFYNRKKDSLQHAALQRQSSPADNGSDEHRISVIDGTIRQSHDTAHGGLQGEQKFPPHSTLLYALFRIADGTPGAESLIPFVHTTLDTMMLRGLHDHLQGGFYRYCVDRRWTVPHFEKMLYDQAMLLWVYALAARVLNQPAWETTAGDIVRCLQETFLDDGLLCAAHDADTDHQEGATYLWSRDELAQLLTGEEFRALEAHFELPQGGNFEGKIHLVRTLTDSAASGTDTHLVSGCRKLLLARRRRLQPFTDRKKLTSWNALAGVGLLNASRLLVQDRRTARTAHAMASTLRASLVRRHVAEDGTVLHGTLDDHALAGRFLEDHAALLLFLSCCHEDRREDADLIEQLLRGLSRFSDDAGWISADERDFFKVPADAFDSPVPSASALAEFARARSLMVLGREYPPVSFGTPLTGDFRSLAALHTRGYVWTVQSPGPVNWDRLPCNVVQTDGDVQNHCLHGVCTPGLPHASETRRHGSVR